MKMLGVVGLVACLSSPAVVAEEVNPVHQRIDAYAVKWWFGNNIENAKGSAGQLLKAIEASNIRGEFPEAQIGIPAIIEHGTAYWLHRYRTADGKLDTLVNAALMMLFLDSDELKGDRREAALILLTRASDMGYEPAKAFIKLSGENSEVAGNPGAHSED